MRLAHGDSIKAFGRSVFPQTTIQGIARAGCRIGLNALARAHAHNIDGDDLTARNPFEAPIAAQAKAGRRAVTAAAPVRPA
jgi:hypothetical protein